MASNAATEESEGGPTAAATTREELVTSLSRHFSEDIDDIIAENVADSDGLSQEQIDSVKSRFQSAFDRVIGTGFDVVFRKELSAKCDGNDSTVPLADMTVTEDDLLRVDDALDRVTQRRQKYPSQLTQFLDKTLLHEADAAKHCQTDVPCPELPSRPSEEGMAGVRPDLGRMLGGGEDGGTDSAVRMEMHRLDEETRRAGDVESAVKALTTLAELSQ